MSISDGKPTHPGDVPVRGLSRACIYWELNPLKVHRDKEGRFVSAFNDIIANCGTCLHYLPDGCKVLHKFSE